MIYDCFTFFNELELLELRLNELAGVVDKFVIVEATRTFTNQPKRLFFQENRELFREFDGRIIHVAVTDSPDVSDPWTVEYFQRNCIARGLAQCRPDDWILVSDLDEIPRATTVKRVAEEHPFPHGFFTDSILRPTIQIFSAWEFSRGRVRRNHPFIFKFQQSLHRHFINCVTVNPPALAHWYGPRMLFYRDFNSAQEIRHSGYKVIENGGWHFTSMGGGERIVEKIKSFAHQEFNQPAFLDARRLDEAIQQGKPLFDPLEELKFVALDETYPRYILENREKFSAWIKPV
jgi:beta-1,4-mannosyl-glycoprotein beta-1,4-N-acetylglucosaminyltransferase